jgi:uncharacterized membrane protein
MTGQVRRDAALMLTACAALLGGLVALYLSLHALGVSSLVCPVAGCDRVQSSPYAKLWGVPIAVLGLGFFVSTLLLAITGLWFDRIRGVPMTGVLVCVSSLGVLAYLPLLYLEVWVIGAVCFWCLVTNLAALVMLLFSCIAHEWRGT